MSPCCKPTKRLLKKSVLKNVMQGAVYYLFKFNSNMKIEKKIANVIFLFFFRHFSLTIQAEKNFSFLCRDREWLRTTLNWTNALKEKSESKKFVIDVYALQFVSMFVLALKLNPLVRIFKLPNERNLWQNLLKLVCIYETRHQLKLV